MGIIKRITDGALGLLFPPRCPVCDCIADNRQLICPACKSALPYIKGKVCEKCGKPVGAARGLCPDCQRAAKSFTQARAVWMLEGEIKEALYRFKFCNRKDYAPFFSKEAAQALEGWIKEAAPEAIVPVPMHKKRERERGYNQSLLIAKELSAVTQIPVRNDIIVKTHNTKPQKELSAVERKNNLKNAFKIMCDDVQLKSILVVDDIYTTGSTADAVAKTLRGAGVGNVYVLCMCTGKVAAQSAEHK